jgi:betaine-aldehyde dehydrogenase
VHEKVRQRFVDRLVDRTRALKLLSEPLDQQADVGSLNNRTLLEKALRHLADAKEKGARFLHGGNNPRHLLLEPTIIEDVTPDMLVAHEATPGPIAPIMTFTSIEEAVEMANATRYGFQAGAFTSGLANAYYLSENIKAGGVYINEATNCWEEMGAFGGVKSSGMGRMLGPWIMDQLSEPKLTLFDIGKVKK